MFGPETTEHVLRIFNVIRAMSTQLQLLEVQGVVDEGKAAMWIKGKHIWHSCQMTYWGCLAKTHPMLSTLRPRLGADANSIIAAARLFVATPLLGNFTRTECAHIRHRIRTGWAVPADQHLFDQMCCRLMMCFLQVRGNDAQNWI